MGGFHLSTASLQRCDMMPLGSLQMKETGALAMNMVKHSMQRIALSKLLFPDAYASCCFQMPTQSPTEHIFGDDILSVGSMKSAGAGRQTPAQSFLGGLLNCTV